MQLFRKIGDELIIVYGPTETVEVGDTLKVEEQQRGIIAQVIESSLLDLPGILEEVVRSEITDEEVRSVGGTDYALYSARIKNMRFARCKIRKEIRIERIVDWTGYSPSRDATITRIGEDSVLAALLGTEKLRYPITIGKDSADSETAISARDLQGLTLVVGRKGMGKSHVAKSLLLGLLAHGAYCVVFDVNDEYTRLGFQPDGHPHPTFGETVIVRRPKKTLRFTLSYMGQEVFLDLLETVGVAEASLYQVRDIWEQLSQEGGLGLTFANLMNEVNRITDGRIRGALQRRLRFLQGPLSPGETAPRTSLITDADDEATTLEAIFGETQKAPKVGKALIVSMKGLDRVTMRAAVQTILSRLQGLLEKRSLPPVFVFAEEAHLYLGETDWLEAVTRMRHLGMYQVYLTNTPTRVPNLIVRQVDNLLLFHLDLEEDARHIGPASRTDEASVALVARALPARRFIAVGAITGEFPIQLTTVSLPTVAAGETILRFSER
jgi:hypothetical protein